MFQGLRQMKTRLERDEMSRKFHLFLPSTEEGKSEILIICGNNR